MTMTCPACKRKFTRTAPRQRFCSKACQWANHLKTKNARRTAQRAAAREARAVERVCAFCGAKFVTSRSNKKYCSRKCCADAKHREASAARSAARLAARTGRVCPVCGGKFTPKKSDAVYCSRACYLSREKDSPQFVKPKEPRPERSSLEKIRAYLALPAAQRWRRLGELTQAERKVASRMWEEAHSGFAGYNS